MDPDVLGAGAEVGSRPDGSGTISARSSAAQIAISFQNRLRITPTASNGAPARPSTRQAVGRHPEPGGDRSAVAVVAVEQLEHPAGSPTAAIRSSRPGTSDGVTTQTAFARRAESLAGALHGSAGSASQETPSSCPRSAAQPSSS